MTLRTQLISRTVLHVWLPLAAFALLICVRMPDIILQGRFWAEEGPQFFANAWVAPPLTALFTSYGGYLNLVANAATLAARWSVPLAWAPYVTIVTGLAFQLCPPLLLLTARDAWLQPIHVRVAAVLLLLLVPCSEEIWLQTLHCQFELLLCCALILALDETTGTRAWFALGLLFLAPLTGVVSIVLLPLFLLRTTIDISFRRLGQTLVLAVPALVQMLFFFHVVPNRGYSLHPGLLLCIVTIRHLALPFLGVREANQIAASLRASLAAGHLPLFAVILPVMFGLLLAGASVWRYRIGAAFWLLAAGILIALVSYTCALGGMEPLLGGVYDQGRYVIVPQSLVSLTILALASVRKGWLKKSMWLMVFWLLFAGAYAFAEASPPAAHGMSWRQEVAAWRGDPHHVLRLWPTGWVMTLTPQQPVIR